MKKGEYGLIFRGTEEFANLVLKYAEDNGLTKADAIRLLVLKGLFTENIIDSETFTSLWLTRKNFRRKLK